METDQYSSCEVMGGICGRNKKCWARSALTVGLRINEGLPVYAQLGRESARSLAQNCIRQHCIFPQEITDLAETGHFPSRPE